MPDSFFTAQGIDGNISVSNDLNTMFIRTNGDTAAVASEAGYGMAEKLLNNNITTSSAAAGYLAGTSSVWPSNSFIDSIPNKPLENIFTDNILKFTGDSTSIPDVSSLWIDGGTYGNFLTSNIVSSKSLPRAKVSNSSSANFISISGLFSGASNLAFQSILASVNTICAGTRALRGIGHTVVTSTLDQTGTPINQRTDILQSPLQLPRTNAANPEYSFSVQLPDDPRTARIQMTVDGVVAYSSSIFYQTLHDAITFAPDYAFTGNATVERNNLLADVENLKTLVDQNNWSSALAYYTAQIEPTIASTMQDVTKQSVTDFMKSDLLSITSDATTRIATIVASNNYGPAQFFKLSADKASYASGDKATLTAKELVFLEREDQEYFLSSSLDGTGQKIMPISDTSWQAITPVLTTGTHTWSISIFVQSKTLVSNYTNLIKVNEEKSLHLNEDLSTETDPAVIAKIQGEITELQIQNTELQVAIVDSREQIGSGETLTFSVQ
jgi:hypothetical protein